MNKRKFDMGRWSFPKNLDGSQESAKFDVEVDLEALVRLLGRKALRNRKGMSKLGAGAVVVRATKIERGVK